MKAIVIDGYGGPDRLVLRERPDPRPGAGELLVRVRAAAVNPVDWKIRRGDLRMFLWISFPYTPGGDVAGEVVEVGAGVSRFKPGDAVVAFVDLKQGGGYAELAVVKESAASLKPRHSASPRPPRCRSPLARRSSRCATWADCAREARS